MWRHSAQSREEETLWLVPSLAELWIQGRWNVRPPADPEGGAWDSRLEVRVGALEDTGVVRSTAGSLPSLRCDPGTTADAATVGLSVKSS